MSFSNDCQSNPACRGRISSIQLVGNAAIYHSHRPFGGVRVVALLTSIGFPVVMNNELGYRLISQLPTYCHLCRIPDERV